MQQYARFCAIEGCVFLIARPQSSKGKERNVGLHLVVFFVGEEYSFQGICDKLLIVFGFTLSHSLFILLARQNSYHILLYNYA